MKNYMVQTLLALYLMSAGIGMSYAGQYDQGFGDNQGASMPDNALSSQQTQQTNYGMTDYNPNN